jgi:hypothetical protein
MELESGSLNVACVNREAGGARATTALILRATGGTAGVTAERLISGSRHTGPETWLTVPKGPGMAVLRRHEVSKPQVGVAS